MPVYLIPVGLRLRNGDTMGLTYTAQTDYEIKGQIKALSEQLMRLKTSAKQRTLRAIQSGNGTMRSAFNLQVTMRQNGIQAYFNNTQKCHSLESQIKRLKTQLRDVARNDNSVTPNQLALAM